MNKPNPSNLNLPTNLPRYTSYPPATFFNASFGEQAFIASVEQSNDKDPQNISIYIHIPFCAKLCHYCGCNAMHISKPDEVKAYVDAVQMELEMVLPRLSARRKVSQIHFGGGSPTAIPIHYLAQLLGTIRHAVSFIDQAEIAIECHPAHLDLSYLATLQGLGFNRISIGVQDFDANVLKASNRAPSQLPFEQLVSYIQKELKASVNLDFIYGLPLQTPQSFRQSIEKAITLQPDRLVCFPYAHFPKMFPRQSLLERKGLPNLADKELMFEGVCEILANTQYQKIGMDHFVLPSDELFDASLNKELHRNFQGYCSRRTTGQVYAFGVSGISQLATCYAQNTKNVPQYIQAINSGSIPIERGYQLSTDQEIQRDIINSLMCNYTFDWTEIAQKYGQSIPDTQQHFIHKPALFDQITTNGWIEQSGNRVLVTASGVAFVRLLATCFDPLINDTRIT